MSCEVVVFTHSEYSDIWPIVNDSIKQCIPESITVHFAVNNNANTSLINYNDLYKYNDNLPYGARIVEVLEQVQSDYVCFFHDIDIIRSFDSTRFQKLLQWMQEEQVDRFYFGVLGSKQFEKNVGDMPVGKSEIGVCDWFTTPYDVGPSIWKRETFLELMREFKDETYRSIEGSKIQEVLSKRKVYAFSKVNIPVYFTIGRPFTEWFTFCHILVRGKWLPTQAFQSHFNFFVEIPQKYGIDISKRGVTDFFHGMLFGLNIS